MMLASSPTVIEWRGWLRRFAREQRAGCWHIYADPLIIAPLQTTLKWHRLSHRVHCHSVPGQPECWMEFVAQ